MAVFKCKMCGGTIEFAPGESVGICDSCGTKQTLPRLDSDKKAQLYDRADHFRRNNEFDKAMGIYEQILNEDEDDAEAYWSLVLCKYGIEYVEDPATHRRIPTVNRAQYTSIFDDEDYKAALRHADGHQREIYEQEAGSINEIQKGILAISAKEEPFDVFICYKETDANGRRTPDSVLANDLYHQLTQEGFKVFFARITLEDKLGSAYEPYIFAALNSAKVMVVLGTRPAYFQAAWVKNEWSRYLALVKESGGKKILIPAYKDMYPYDLPDEFSHLQAQDMSKLGFMQDLIRGIRKIIGAEGSAKPVVTSAAPSVNIGNLLSLARTALEMGDLSEALERANAALSSDVACSEAWEIKRDIIVAQIKVHPSNEVRLREVNTCAANIIKYADANGREEAVLRNTAMYEECLEIYVGLFLRKIKGINNLYDIGTVGIASMEKEKLTNKANELYQQFLLFCENVYETKNSFQIIMPLYTAFAIRVDIIKQQLYEWSVNEREKLKPIVNEISAFFMKAKAALIKSFPSRNFDVSYVAVPRRINEPVPTFKVVFGVSITFLILGLLYLGSGDEFAVPIFLSILLVIIPMFIVGFCRLSKYREELQKYERAEDAIRQFKKKLNE